MCDGLGFVLSEGFQQVREGLWFVAIEVFLVDEDKVVADTILASVDVVTPLFEALHLKGDVKVFEAFGLDDKELTGRFLDDEIGEVIGDFAFGVDIVNLELDGEIILYVGDDVGAVFEEAGEFKFQGAVADNSVEDAFFRNEVTLVFGDERTGFAELDGVPDQGVAASLDGESVDGSLESVEDGFSGDGLGLRRVTD